MNMIKLYKQINNTAELSVSCCSWRLYYKYILNLMLHSRYFTQNAVI